jgi:hypothetical protein
MSAALDHRLVREYLRELDNALVGLPAAQAGELREQIATHIDDLLVPGADDDEVAAALRRLGAPAELAAEAAELSAAGTRGARGPRRTLRARLAGLGWRRWLLAGAGTLLAVLALAYYIAVQTAPELIFNGAAGWWYPQDSERQVSTSADGASQTTVPIRSGQRQGFAVDLTNTSRWTQVVLGPATGPNVGWDSPGSPTVQLGVNTPNFNIDGGGFSDTGVKFVLPGAIPPGQTRLLRVLWTSTVCMKEKDAVGIDHLVLRVRVGWITRIETVNLDQGWFLAGPSQGRCG